jgi:hypothetical protein
LPCKFEVSEEGTELAVWWGLHGKAGVTYLTGNRYHDICRFCAIVIVLRQAIGKGLSGFHALRTSLYLEAGLGTTAFCMLPPLLALCGIPLLAVWRTSSAVIIVVILLDGWTYPRRRRIKRLERLPPRRWLPIAIGSAVVIMDLLANVLGIPFPTGASLSAPSRRSPRFPRSQSPFPADARWLATA